MAFVKNNFINFKENFILIAIVPDLIVKSNPSLRQGRGLEDVTTSDNMCNFFTGISSVTTLLILFKYLKNSLPASGCANFSKDRVFIMTLSKMRLGTSFTEIGYNYGISRQTATKFFYETLFAINDGLRFVLQPPTKGSAAIHNPPKFKSCFGDRRVFLLDCFEVRCNTPGRPKAGISHFSGYKRTHTVKFLIAGHPDGTIGFVSKAYGGRCSDLFITEHCGILDCLEPGDVVLADKGFDIQGKLCPLSIFLSTNSTIIIFSILICISQI